MKICFVASSGGHWEELMCLSDLFEDNECYYVTEKGGQASECHFENIYTFNQINRKERFFIIHFLKLCSHALRILKSEKPDVIITTGALVCVPFCYLAKLLKKKVIYIESFARVNSPSLTGRLVYRVSDLFLVQWESMLKFYPKARYVGGIF